MLAVLAGPDGRDAGAIPVPLGDPGQVEVSRLRILLQLTDGVDDPVPEIERAVRDTAAALAGAGANVSEGSLPPGGHELTERIWDSYDEDGGSLTYHLLRDWDRHRSAMLAILDDVDLIVAPVAPHAAVAPGAPISWRYTTPHSLTGWPCAVVRAGSYGLLPIGVQVVAGPWQDHVALAAAAVIERALGGWQPPA